MTGVVAAEWIRMRSRRFVLGPGGAIVGVPVLVAVMLRVLVSDVAAGSGRLGQLVSVEELSRPEGVAVPLELSAGLLILAALVVAAVQIGRDLTGGTWRAQLVTLPRRVTLLLGKALALASFIAVALLVAAVVSVAVARGAVGPTVGDTDVWFSASGVVALAGAWVNVTLAAVAWSAVGVALAVLTRSTVAAISVGLLLPLLVEPALGAIAPGLADWLPTEALQSLARGGDELAYGPALVYAVALTGGALAVGARVAATRDVTG